MAFRRAPSPQGVAPPGRIRRLRRFDAGRRAPHYVASRRVRRGRGNGAARAAPLLLRRCPTSSPRRRSPRPAQDKRWTPRLPHRLGLPDAAWRGVPPLRRTTHACKTVPGPIRCLGMERAPSRTQTRPRMQGWDMRSRRRAEPHAGRAQAIPATGRVKPGADSDPTNSN
jgi:hypothetical protein